MPRINLLPWREEQRKRRQKTFNAALIGAAILAIIVVGYWHHVMSRNVDYQNQRNRYLKTEIARLDKRIASIKTLKKQRQALVSRMKVIEKLQQSRPLAVHVFDQLIKTLPDGIYLTRVSEQGDTLNVKGDARSSARISTYMRNIAHSPWLDHPNLTVIKDDSKGGTHKKTFSLSAEIVAKKASAKGDKS
jgi:type IV pilus assembly protein PilN